LNKNKEDDKIKEANVENVRFFIAFDLFNLIHSSLFLIPSKQFYERVFSNRQNMFKRAYATHFAG